MLEDLVGLSQQGSDRRQIAPKESWRPHLELDADGGYFVSSPRPDEPSNSAELLAEFDLNPDEWIVTSVRRSKWQSFNGEWLNAFRVNVVPARARTQLLDADEIEREIKAWRPAKNSRATDGSLTAIYNVGDTQWGKDAGDGTAGTVRRVMEGLQAALIRHKEISKRGIGQIAIPQLGDCIEGVVSQGGKIAGRLDLSLTQQIRLGRRMLFEWVKAFAPLTNDLIIPVVPGNHDESHRQLITDPMDSWQVEIVQQVLDMCGENKDLSHVSGRFAEPDNSTLTVEMNGAMIGFAHGHQLGSNAVKWWQEQAMGRTAIGSAEVLITAHFHHFRADQIGPNLWVQIPAADGGSPWFRDRRGLESPTGVVSLVVGAGYDPRKDLTVLSGEWR